LGASDASDSLAENIWGNLMRQTRSQKIFEGIGRGKCGNFLVAEDFPVAADLANPQPMGVRNFSSDKQSLADIKSLKWSIGCKHLFLRMLFIRSPVGYQHSQMRQNDSPALFSF